MDIFRKFQTQKVTGYARTTVNIECKTGSVWEAEDAMCMMGLEKSGVLRPFPTINNQFEPCINQRMARMDSENTENSFCSITTFLYIQLKW